MKTQTNLAKQLRGAGMSFAAIGEILSVSKSQAARLADPYYIERERSYRQSLHGRCKQAISNSKYGAEQRGYSPCTSSLDTLKAAWTGYCGHCGVSDGESRLGIDHDHVTGEFRAWLCNRCNVTQAACFDDNPANMTSNKFMRGRIGVSWDENSGKWKAYCRQSHLGSYDDPISAAHIRDNYVNNKGIRAPMNHPPERRLGVIPVSHDRRGRYRPKGKASGVSSQYVGVTYYKRSGKWRARVCAGGQERFIGCFNTDIEAAHARDAVARLYGLPLNFPERVA